MGARKIRFAFVAASAAAVAFSFAGASAQTASTAAPSGAPAGSIQGSPNITYPVPELGGCGDQNSCKAYCNDASHMQACISFAESHGLMDKSQASQAQSFAQALSQGGGPGGCASPDACDAYCTDIQNIDACVAFAKAHGIQNGDLAQAEKISAYLKQGGAMPGGCTSKESCQAYCGDFSHAEECYKFAQGAGITQAPGGGGPNGGPNGGQMPSPEQFQKFMQLVQSGQTPGGCKSQEECQSYCGNGQHAAECLAFAQSAGFISAAQAQQIQATGGKGPGGCDSPQACDAYCSNQQNQQACFQFGEQNGFINQGQAQQMQQGMVQMRAGLEQASPDVLACLKSKLGDGAVTDIESGKVVPTPDMADSIRSCFDQYAGQKEGNPEDIFKNLPGQVKSCVQSALGDTYQKIVAGTAQPTPAMGDTVRTCFQKNQLENFGNGGPEGGFGNGGPNGPSLQDMIQHIIQTAPGDVADCVQKFAGTLGAASSTQTPPGEIMQQIANACFEHGGQNGGPNGEGGGNQGGDQNGPGNSGGPGMMQGGFPGNFPSGTPPFGQFNRGEDGRQFGPMMNSSSMPPFRGEGENQNAGGFPPSGPMNGSGTFNQFRGDMPPFQQGNGSGTFNQLPGNPQFGPQGSGTPQFGPGMMQPGENNQQEGDNGQFQNQPGQFPPQGQFQEQPGQFPASGTPPQGGQVPPPQQFQPPAGTSQTPPPPSGSTPPPPGSTQPAPSSTSMTYSPDLMGNLLNLLRGFLK